MKRNTRNKLSQRIDHLELQTREQLLEHHRAILSLQEMRELLAHQIPLLLKSNLAFMELRTEEQKEQFMTNLNELEEQTD